MTNQFVNQILNSPFNVSITIGSILLDRNLGALMRALESTSKPVQHTEQF